MKNTENRNYRFIQTKAEIADKMKRIKEVFDLYNMGYNSKEIAKIMDLPNRMIKFWIGSTYFYILERTTPTDPVKKQEGNLLWLDNKIYTEMNKRLDKEKKQKSKKLQKAS